MLGGAATEIRCGKIAFSGVWAALPEFACASGRSRLFCDVFRVTH